ncbi:hypothetical protein RSOLAG1IB_05375 [Rhizoctonia solani AG-1 IB]|uniref:Jacalin-type lectin domain-containing protein n=1 Tax=Thanatephorus cucumeris (strain AG1-IB / isolate 7/3/14) TaxID=1108050 RepID=A0A0B7FZE1_THACB|nr:hypothetical protein RSOLAG1IB_05375 [Rhizoctonia solani AG-1 IB]
MIFSDLNVIISVKVVNQTTNSDTVKHFHTINGVTEENFHYVYGDSYISGFIDGGEFHGLVSIKVLDSSQKEEIVSSLKEKLNGTDPKSFALNTINQTFATELKQTETSIFVNWSGGGQIKPADEQWTLDAVFRAAAGFPNRVAQYPQRCWAILTWYPNNFSFLNSNLKSIRVRNFANVQQYAADLLDDFMHYKSNLRIIENVLDEPIEYGVGPGERPVDVRAQDLVNSRIKIKAEMAKIVKVIEALDKDPVAGMKYKPSDIEPPEVWATRLPVQRTTLDADHPELAPISESINNVLQGFNFVWTDNEKERAELARQIQNPRPPQSKPPVPPPPPPHIVLPKAREGMTKQDLEWVDSYDNRRKYAGFLFDQSGGIPDQSISFNDVFEIEQSSLSQTWPTKLELRLTKRDDKSVFVCYRLSYSGSPPKEIKNGHTEDLAKVPTNKNDELILDDLSSTSRIIGVRIAIGNDKGSLHRINSIEIDVKDGQRQGIGTIANGDVVVSCSAPEGFGLKGFYGNSKGSESIERIGVIWGK